MSVDVQWIRDSLLNPEINYVTFERVRGGWEMRSFTRIPKDPSPFINGYRDSDASLAEDPKGLSGEAVAARASEGGIAQ